jgi:hypothetical protein
MAVLECEAAARRAARGQPGGGGGADAAPGAISPDVAEELIALAEETGEGAWGLWSSLSSAFAAALPAPELAGLEALPLLRSGEAAPGGGSDALSRAAASAAAAAPRVDDPAAPAAAGAALALQEDLIRLLDAEAGRCRAEVLQRPKQLSLLSALGPPSATAGVSIAGAQAGGGGLRRGGGGGGGGSPASARAAAATAAAATPSTDSRFALEPLSPRGGKSPARGGATVGGYTAALRSAQADPPYSTRGSLTAISAALAAGGAAPPPAPAGFLLPAASPRAPAGASSLSSSSAAAAAAVSPRSPFSRVNWQLVVDAGLKAPATAAHAHAAFASPAADAYILRAPPPTNAGSTFVR